MSPRNELIPSVIAILVSVLLSWAVAKAAKQRKRASNTKPAATQGTFEIEPEPLLTDGDYGIYQLYTPDTPGDVAVDIVFFHGLQTDSANAEHAWWQTWMTTAGSSAGPGSVCWPQAWLPRKFPHARVLSVCYKANAFSRASDGKSHWETLAGSVLGYLTSGNVGVGEGGRPVFLVGHSMGGLIIKQLLLKANFLATVKTADAVREAQLLKGVRGVAFYATPHRGSFLEQWTRSVLVNNGIFRFHVGQPEEALLNRLAVFDKDTNALNVDFYDVFKLKGMKALCLTEGKPMELPILGSKTIVEQAAASLDFARNISVSADHITICKPRSEVDIPFMSLVDFIKANLTAQGASS